jgi:5'-AMP-activated protein kinase regulatory beta subunit
VDGDWRYDPNQKAMYDEMGNINNTIEVQEYVPENLDNISGFDPPPSPPARWVGLLGTTCGRRWQEV